MSALQSYAADHNGDLTSLEASNGAYYQTDGSTASGLSGYIGKLSQTKLVIIWKTGTSGMGTGKSGFGWMRQNRNDGSYIGVAVGMTCVAVGASTNSSSSNSSPDAAVWAFLSNGAAYCVDM